MKTRIETAKTIVQPRSRRNLPSLTVSFDGSIDLKKRGFDSKQTRTLFSVTFLLRCVSHLATASLPTMRGVNTLRGTSKVVPRKGLELGMLGWSLRPGPCVTIRNHRFPASNAFRRGVFDQSTSQPQDCWSSVRCTWFGIPVWPWQTVPPAPTSPAAGKAAPTPETVSRLKERPWSSKERENGFP